MPETAANLISGALPSTGGGKIATTDAQGNPTVLGEAIDRRSQNQTIHEQIRQKRRVLVVIDRPLYNPSFTQNRSHASSSLCCCAALTLVRAGAPFREPLQ